MTPRLLIRRWLGLAGLTAFVYDLNTKVEDMTQLVDDLVSAVAAIPPAIDALEAAVTVAIANSGNMSQEDKDKITKAIADLKAAAADAADGVDEAAPVAPAP